MFQVVAVSCLAEVWELVAPCQVVEVVPSVQVVVEEEELLAQGVEEAVVHQDQVEEGEVEHLTWEVVEEEGHQEQGVVVEVLTDLQVVEEEGEHLGQEEAEVVLRWSVIDSCCS